MGGRVKVKKGMGPRACPLCGGLFIASGMRRTQVAVDAPILPYRGGTGVAVGQCPHCEKLLTSEAFEIAGQLIPWNAPMLEAEVQDVAEGSPLPEAQLSRKLSQDDVPGWVRERNRQAAVEARAKLWP